MGFRDQFEKQDTKLRQEGYHPTKCRLLFGAVGATNLLVVFHTSQDVFQVGPWDPLPFRPCAVVGVPA